MNDNGAPKSAAAPPHKQHKASSGDSGPRRIDYDRFTAELRRRARQRVRHDSLWRAGAPGEQLALEES